MGAARYIIKGYSPLGVFICRAVWLYYYRALMGHKVLPASETKVPAGARHIVLNAIVLLLMSRGGDLA